MALLKRCLRFPRREPDTPESHHCRCPADHNFARLQSPLIPLCDGVFCRRTLSTFRSVSSHFFGTGSKVEEIRCRTSPWSAIRVEVLDGQEVVREREVANMRCRCWSWSGPVVQGRASSMSSVNEAKSSGTCTPLLGFWPSPLKVVEPGALPRLSSFVPDVELVPPVLGLFSASLASSPFGLRTVFDPAFAVCA